LELGRQRLEVHSDRVFNSLVGGFHVLAYRSFLFQGKRFGRAEAYVGAEERELVVFAQLVYVDLANNCFSPIVYTVGLGEYLLGVAFPRIKNSVKKYPPRVRITYYDLWREKRFELGTCYCLGFLKSPIQ
jgi:hypothetical protein